MDDTFSGGRAPARGLPVVITPLAAAGAAPMTLDELTITLSDKDGDLSVDTLKKALENSLDMLPQLEASVVASGVEVRWEVVRVRMRSPLKVTLSPRGVQGRSSAETVGRQLVKSAYRYVDRIENGETVPHPFIDGANEATRKLVKSAISEGAAVAFEAANTKVTLTGRGR